MPARPPRTLSIRPLAAAEDRADDGSLPRSEAVEDALVKAAGVVLFTLFTGLGAFISIPMQPYGIPLTLQTLAVVCAALCLGPKLGVASMLLYVALGTLGLPLFAEGESGVGVLLGQTGGYILGFALCQPVICGIIRRRDGSVRGWGALAASVLVGHLVIFAVGVPWLYLSRRYWLDAPALSPISLRDALHYGFVVYIPGMFLKSALAVWIGWAVNPWVSRRFW